MLREDEPRLRTRSLVWASTALFALVGCGGDTTSAGPGGAGGEAVGGAGAGGGAGGLGGAQSGGAGQGGAAGAGGGRAGCDPFDAAACDAGLVCTVIDETLGLEGGTACVTPGTKPAYSACAGAGECEAGTYCDFVTATCKPICQNSLDCPGESACSAAQTGSGAPIPGLKLCVAECEPVATTACDSSEGPVNCTWREDLLAFDCVSAGPKGEAFACAEHSECDVGLGCLEVNGAFACFHWCVYDGGTDICTAAEHPDATFALCVPQIPGISVSGTDYGGCLKQL